MNSKILSNQIKYVQYSNNIKDTKSAPLNLKQIKTDYTELCNLYVVLKEELQQIKIENDDLNIQISNIKTISNNICITNNSINNELNLLKSSLENLKKINNKLEIENDTLLRLNNMLIKDFENLNNEIDKLEKLNK